MDYTHKFRKQLMARTLLAVLTPVVITLVVWFLCSSVLDFEDIFSYIVAGSVGISFAIFSSVLLSNQTAKPVETLADIVSYASHNGRNDGVPLIDNLKLAKELIDNLSRQIYNMASSVPESNNSANNQAVVQNESAQIIIDGLPVPVFGIDEANNVTVVNAAAATYLGKNIEDIRQKPLYDSLNLSFQSDESLDDWLAEKRKSAVTANRTWDRVRHQVNQDSWKQFDLVVSFSSGKSTGTETMLAIFDKSERYNIDDEEVSYVALAVHELRTPLTMMRGYIEVFEDELSNKLTPELKDFMYKMQASAEQLTSFVSNILNVARIEENQLVLKLRSEEIAGILKSAINDLELRAQVYGKHIELKIAEGLPPVAADRTSVQEIINNLVDNAIKYSDKSEKIIVTATKNNDGLVEISVQDFGIGIPSSVIGQLFQKFHRSHKSKVQVGGTGLGLFLCKAMVKAQGGNIWVRSKEGEGSIFSFTLIPYDQMSEEQLAGEDGIIRGAHGWIKNHSLYRN